MDYSSTPHSISSEIQHSFVPVGVCFFNWNTRLCTPLLLIVKRQWGEETPRTPPHNVTMTSHRRRILRSYWHMKEKWRGHATAGLKGALWEEHDQTVTSQQVWSRMETSGSSSASWRHPIRSPWVDQCWRSAVCVLWRRWSLHLRAGTILVKMMEPEPSDPPDPATRLRLHVLTMLLACVVSTGRIRRKDEKLLERCENLTLD